MTDLDELLRALVGTILATAAWLLLQVGKALADAARKLE